MKVKKNIERIGAMELYELLGKKHHIDPKIVEDIFDSYYEIYIYCIQARKKLTLPRIGQFCFDFKKGKVAGQDVYDVSMKSWKTLTETRPSYCRSVFEVFKKTQEEVRALTSELF